MHEGGHNLFGWFGPTLGLWGGTLLQWLVPFLLAAYFFSQRQTTGFVFCLFFFFENWLYTATYMADARAQVLPLVTTGDPDFVEHDWYRHLFESRCSEPRHADRVRGAGARLVRDDRSGRLAGRKSKSRRQVTLSVNRQSQIGNCKFNNQHSTIINQ